MSYEGVIKFSCNCIDEEHIIAQKYFDKLNPIRQNLFDKKYIGCYPDDLSYGNISVRCQKSNGFVITASDTGRLLKTSINDYVKIIKCNLETNTCTYKGTAKPSSETLSHYVFYAQIPDTSAVIHIHNNSLWVKLKGMVPATNEAISYGSVGMAKAISELLKNSNLRSKKILIMGGHEDGIITFGASLEEAKSVLEYYEYL